MYQECISCPKIGISCDGPNFMTMAAPELLEWCKARKAHLGLSNAKLAEMSGMAKGTIDRLFAGEHVDFRFETIRPLVMALVGGERSGSPCPDPHADENETAALQEQVQRLLRNNKLLQEHIDRDNEQHQQQLDFLRNQIKHEQASGDGYKKAVIILSVFLGMALLIIIAALVADRLNDDVGFFWLDRVFAPLMTKL